MAFKRKSRWVVWLALGVAVAGAVAGGVTLLRRPAPTKEEAWPAVAFVDITDRSGVRFTHTAGRTARKLLPETMGSGVAVIDFDRDGRPDLLFVNGRPWPGLGSHAPPTLALYRNRGDGSFEDVTKAMRLDVALYGMGATVGDYDNDGWPDLFVTAVGGNRLFRNVGGRHFLDVTAEARVGGPGGWPGGAVSDFFLWDRPLTWSTSATWVDYDGDGWLDLFVCNYVTWSPARDSAQPFRLASGDRAYGPPRAFPGAHCFLYRNRGGGHFEDVSKSAGVEVARNGEAVGKSLGVVACDVDEDGWPDLIVANDTVRNFFFHNVPDGSGGRRFEEVGEWTGVAFADRAARGAMGIDWQPGFRDRRGAVLIGNFADEPNTLLVQQRARELAMIDLAPGEGLAGPSRSLLKFGLFFFDYDLDGRADLLTCNGHLEPDIARALPEQSFAQSVQLYWDGGDGRSPRYGLVPAGAAGPDLFRPLVGRGCAYLDVDGDGSLDVVLTANGGPARVLRNDNRTGHHWLRLRLVGDGQRGNASAIGARVVVEAGGREQRREVCAARGYLSQSELVLTFGLGAAGVADRVTVHWPGKAAGPPMVLTGVAAGREHVVRQGR